MHTNVWDRHAVIDPYGAAVGRVGDGARRWADRAAFRRTGQAEVDRYVPQEVRFRRGLDLGCGPGRHLAALAARAEHVVGFDLSDPMRAEARRTVADVPNVEIVGDRSSLGAHGSYDLIWSRLVLQHQPDAAASQRMLDLIAELGAPEGVVVIQVVHARTASVPRLRAVVGWCRWRLARRRLPRMPMTAVDEATFGMFLGAHGLRVLHAGEDGGAAGWRSLTYVLRRDPDTVRTAPSGPRRSPAATL